MTHESKLLQSSVLRVQMMGLSLLGLDMSRMQACVGPLPDEPDTLVPLHTAAAMWDEAQEQYGRPGLPTALAMAIPFGAFGALDYLVSSANTIASCCESTMLNCAMVWADLWLEHETDEDGIHLLRVRWVPGTPTAAVEFKVSSFVSRLRYVSDGAFQPIRVGLPVPKPASDPVRARLYGTHLEYDFPCAEIAIDPETWNSETASADTHLHTALKHMVNQLQLSRSDSALEDALRARLRVGLLQRQAEPERIAALLGVSERTLQRRLAEKGLSFTDVLESFRKEESARLLCNHRVSLVEIACRLGYAEQTSFTRAFKRWTGTTPAAWRKGRRTVS